MASALAVVLAAATVVASGMVQALEQGIGPDPPGEQAGPLLALHVEQALEPTVREMWRLAPTFRRQVLRVASEPALVVTIAVWRFAPPSGPRATTHFSRAGGLLRAARVEVRPADDLTLVELIAHELEHVLEQLDGVSLDGSRHDRVVSATVDGRQRSFETARARQVGMDVVTEYSARAGGRDRRHGARR